MIFICSQKTAAFIVLCHNTPPTVDVFGKNLSDDVIYSPFIFYQ